MLVARRPLFVYSNLPLRVTINHSAIRLRPCFSRTATSGAPHARREGRDSLPVALLRQDFNASTALA